MVREIKETELKELLELYLYLHEDSIPDMTDSVKSTWENIAKDENHHIIVNEVNGKIVSSCVCVIIPNLTRGVRPYALVENVVTHLNYRGHGYATEGLKLAIEEAKRIIFRPRVPNTAKEMNYVKNKELFSNFYQKRNFRNILNLIIKE